LYREGNYTSCTEKGSIPLVQRRKLYLLYREGKYTSCTEKGNIPLVQRREVYLLYREQTNKEHHINRINTEFHMQFKDTQQRLMPKNTSNIHCGLSL